MHEGEGLGAFCGWSVRVATPGYWRGPDDETVSQGCRPASARPGPLRGSLFHRPREQVVALWGEPEFRPDYDVYALSADRKVWLWFDPSGRLETAALEYLSPPRITCLYRTWSKGA